jgi:type IV pilus assembly protein PilY1
MIKLPTILSNATGIFMAALNFGAVAAGTVPSVDIASGPMLSCRGNSAGNALVHISNGSASISTASMTNSPDGVFVFQSGFSVSTWSGSLRKLPVLFGSDGTASVGATPLWDAATLLTGTNSTAPSPSADLRRIYIGKISAEKTLAAVPFTWDRLDQAQRAALNASPLSGKADGLGEKRVNYLRGTRSLERAQPQGIFRTRESILGDMVNSEPVHVGPPASAEFNDAYRSFYATHRDRKKVIYIGANDGMLHAFDADNGQELFAYIPNMLLPVLNKLTAPEYVHRPYVDSTVVVGDAIVGKKWKTVLAGGLGGGGQGVYVLDVSNPSDFAAGGGVIFEFTDSDDPDMGNVVGVPQIAKFKVKAAKGAIESKYFVVVASGLNNYKDDGARKFDDAAPGVLFLLSLGKEPTEKWQSGVNYYKLKTPISNTRSPNGLASPGIVVNGDGAVRFIYAGDLQGNLWRFSFEGNAPWTDALGKAPYTPLFTAVDDKMVPQPITVQPRIVFAPGGGYLVLFGTGKFLERSDADATQFKTQSFYAIHDVADGAVRVQRSELMPRQLRRVPIDGGDLMEVSGGIFSYGSAVGSKKGWYFDFPESDKTGERSVAGAALANGRLFFNSLLPDREPCGPGMARTYVIDTLTGLPPGGSLTGLSSEGVLLGSPVLAQVKLETSDRNSIGKRTVKKKASVLKPGQESDQTSRARKMSSDETILTAGRLSWREIVNWQELRDASAKR